MSAAITSRNGQEVWYPREAHYSPDDQCGEKTWNGYCRVARGHDGDHNGEANWDAHAEVKAGYSFEVAFRSEHDARGIHLRTLEEVQELCEYLLARAGRHFQS